VEPGDKVVIVEDVITSGGSAMLAMERAQEAGLHVLGVVAVIDRLEGGAATLAARGCPLQTLFTIRDFGIEPPATL
jgi:orotate phosphoribosyltransferase